MVLYYLTTERHFYKKNMVRNGCPPGCQILNTSTEKRIEDHEWMIPLLSAKILTVLYSLSAEERQTFKHFDAEVMCMFSLFASLANTSVGDIIWKLYLIYCDHRVSYKSHFKNIGILYFPEKSFLKILKNAWIGKSFSFKCK